MDSEGGRACRQPMQSVHTESWGEGSRVTETSSLDPLPRTLLAFQDISSGTRSPAVPPDITG